jgi:hypothetical protein
LPALTVLIFLLTEDHLCTICVWGVVGLPSLVAELSIILRNASWNPSAGAFFFYRTQMLSEGEGEEEDGKQGNGVYEVFETAYSHTKQAARHVIDVVYSPWCSGSTSDCNIICVQKTLVVGSSDWTRVRNSLLTLNSDPRRGECSALLCYLFLVGCSVPRAEMLWLLWSELKKPEDELQVVSWNNRVQNKAGPFTT